MKFSEKIIAQSLKFYLVSYGGEFENADILVEESNSGIQIDYHLDHATTLKVGLEQASQFVVSVGHLHLNISIVNIYFK
jgi:hypothetical protein